MNFYQCMRVMKITMMLMTCLLVQVSASTFGQRITLNKQNSNIPSILQEFRKQSQYDFFMILNYLKIPNRSILT